MNSRPYLLACGITALALLLPLSVRADIVIDDFSLPTPALDYAIAPGPNPTVIQTDLGSGTTRIITLNVTSPTPPRTNSLTGTIAGLSGFSASFDIFSRGTIELVYNFDSIQNFTSITPEVGEIRFMSSANSGFAPNLPLGITIQTTTGDRTYSGFLAPSNTMTGVSIALSAFAGSGDLTSVTGVRFNLDAGQAADFSIDNIVSSPIASPNAIPAPAGIWLALGATPLLAWRRLRRKS